ncbi:MAG: response regulator [Candidatus Eremiobacterota bacterium]
MEPVILIVDDEPSARDTLSGILFGRGYDLVFADNGMEALKKAGEIKPDLILLDIMMPDMDGFEVCRRLRQDVILAEVPIIMITALDDQDSYIDGIEAGADDFISKPYNRVKLRSRIKTITRLNRYRLLHQEREKFEWVVEESDDGYIILNNKEEVIYINPKAKFYLDLSEERNIFISETFTELAKKHYMFEPKHAWNTWPCHLPAPPRYMVRPANKNSGPFWLHVEVREISGGYEAFIVRLRNVTDKIASRTNMWTFHSMISHKLRTPLAPLEAIFEFFDMDRSLLSSEEMDSLLTEAHQAALRIKNQLVSITDYITSRDLIKPYHGTCSAGNITDIIEEIKKEITDISITVYCKDIYDMDNTCINFSVPAMKMVLTELIFNSRKFHPEKKPDIQIDIFPVPEGIEIKISDNGITLSPEQLLNMWIPYHQAEKYFTGEVSGMGLGLSAVASLIWSTGGKCRSHNREDMPGIVIELIFPLMI